MDSPSQRIEDVDHQPDHGARRVELASLLVRGVGKLFNEVFVGLAEDVGLCHPVAQRHTREMLDKVAQQRVGEAVFVGPLGVTKDAVERFRVRLLDATQGGLQRLPHIGSHCSYITPVTTFWHLEAVVLREASVFLVAPGFLQRCLVLLIMHVGEALEEQEREDVGLEVRRIHRPAQDIGGFPEMRFELIEGDSVPRHAAIPHGLCRVLRIARHGPTATAET